MGDDERISVVLITGGIGAGKSRCVNALLASLPAGARCAVCVHAFALSFGLETTAIDRDRVLLYDEVYDVGSGCEMYDVGSGCVCCSPRGDFSRLLYKVAQHDGAITHLLVETTGVAEPLVFAKALYATAFATRFRLAAVLHVLDSRALPSKEDTAPWRAAAAAQLAVASLVCINVRAEPSADELSPVEEESEAGDTQPQPDDRDGPQLGGTVKASVGASIELVSGAAGAASDLAGVFLDATSQFASVTIDGASNILGGAVSSVSSLATGNVGGTTDGLTKIGTAGMSAVSGSAGVLLGAATELGTLGIERVGNVGRKALMAAATVTSAALDDVIGLPSKAADAVGGAGRASFSLAHGLVSAAAAGVMSSHSFVSELLGGAAPSAARVIACLAPGASSAAAGALLWETIASAGAFLPELALAVDPDFLAPSTDTSELYNPTVQGGHFARVACVCATEVGTPLIEARLRAWLDELSQSGRAIRIKGRVWAHTDVADVKPPRLIVVDGLREAVEFWEQSAHPNSASGSEAADAHKMPDQNLTSKLFMVLEPGENAALIKKAFRECFVPPGYAWAADVEIDFPPQSGDAAPRGIERQLQDGPTVVLWRVGSKLYACEAHCPHAGAPLIDGSVLDMEDAARCVARLMPCGFCAKRLLCVAQHHAWPIAELPAPFLYVGPGVGPGGVGELRPFEDL